MKENNFDRKKAIADMQNLKNEAINKIKKRMIAEGKTDINEEELNDFVTIKYLDKIDLINERGEQIESVAGYVVIEQIGGQLQIIYYDENQEFLGAQVGIDGDIISSTEDELVENEKDFASKKAKIKKPEEEQMEKAKTLEQLQEEQRKQEEKQQGPQLTLEQAAKLYGPKIPLSQPVDKDITLENKIGTRGEFIVFADINKVKEWIPDLEIAELGQKFVPIVIGKNGANVVSEDKMRFSTMKGSNSTELSITENNDGTRTLDQSIVTFEIQGTNNYISVGFNEQHTSDPYYECKFQTIDRDSNKLGGEELLQSHVGTIEDPEQHNQRRNNTEGQLKYTTETVSNEQAERAAKKLGFWMHDKKGEVTGLDLDKARLYLLRESVGEKSVEEVIEDIDEGVKQIGDPSNNPYMDE